MEMVLLIIMIGILWSKVFIKKKKIEGFHVKAIKF